MLVGVDDHSDFPADIVTRLPRIGPDLAVDAAAVTALQPDLVLTSLTVPGHEKCVDDLQNAGLPLLICQPQSLADVVEDIRRIARALGVVEQGETLANRLSAVASRPCGVGGGRKPAILVEWWPKPVIVPGRLSWVTDLIALAGGVNPFGDREVESTPITDEEAVSVRPDAVVMSWCGVAEANYRPRVVRRRAAWQDTPALRNDRIFPVTEAWLGRPGPRLIEGLEALSRIVDACRNDN